MVQIICFPCLWQIFLFPPPIWVGWAGSSLFVYWNGSRPDRRSLHMWSSLCTASLRGFHPPFPLTRLCWRCVNIPHAPGIMGTIIWRSPRKQFHPRRDHCVYFSRAGSNTSLYLSICLYGRVSIWSVLYRDHPMVTFGMDHVESLLCSLFSDISCLQWVSISMLGRNTLSTWCNRLCNIFHLAVGLPWTNYMMSSR